MSPHLDAYTYSGFLTQAYTDAGPPAMHMRIALPVRPQLLFSLTTGCRPQGHRDELFPSLGLIYHLSSGTLPLVWRLNHIHVWIVVFLLCHCAV